MIEGLAIILHEHGLEVKDLWREFDLNRAPSPFLYLERDAWIEWAELGGPRTGVK